METPITTKPTIISIRDHTKDIQIALLRKTKYFRAVKQFNETENVPIHLVNRFLKSLKSAKTLSSLNFKWSYIPGLQLHPEVLKSICKLHSRTLKEFQILVLYLIIPYNYQNILTPLKTINTLTIDSNKKDIEILPALKTIKKLYIDLRFETSDYELLHKTLCKLPNLTKLCIMCVPKALTNVLSLFDRITTTKNHSIKFEVATEGEQPQSAIPNLHEETGKHIRKMSLRYVHSSSFLEELFGKSPFHFQNLKTLKLDFKNTESNIINYLKYLNSIPQLEDLTLSFNEPQHGSFASSLLREFKVPASLKNLDLRSSLLLKNSISKDNLLLLNDYEGKVAYPWRDRNIFEEDPSFVDFFETFEKTKELKSLTLEFDLLEEFDIHYTNFFISIMKRIPYISSVSFQVCTKTSEMNENTGKKQSCFDIAYFISSCGKLEHIKEIEISMPNFLFDDVEISSSMNSLQTFILRTVKQEGKKSIKFSNISHSIQRLLKTLHHNSPNLSYLVFGFNELLDQSKLLQRFILLEKFKNLQTFSGKFSVKECDGHIVKQIGSIIKSLVKLKTLRIYFPESASNLEGLQDYVKYHKSIRDLFVFFKESVWFDNDCLIDTLRANLKGKGSEGSYVSFDSDIFDEEDESEESVDNGESEEEMESSIELE